MALLEILQLPDERLKQVSEPVEVFDDELRAFIADLEETRLNGPAAVGIAAPQVGMFKRVVIIDCSTTRKPVPNHGYMVLVNPEITKWDGFEKGREGCLSVPDYTGNVIRATKITLSAKTLTVSRFNSTWKAMRHELLSMRLIILMACYLSIVW